MTREERENAIKVIRNFDLNNSKVNSLLFSAEEITNAFDMAIKALEQQPCERFEWSIDGNVYKITKAKDGKEICQQVCDDAISRKAAINIVSLHCLTIDETVKAIKSLPSVTQKSAKDYLDMADRKAKKIKDALTDNSQKYGKWIKSRCDMYVCSECDHIYTDLSGERYGMNYCPNCGSRMVEPQESE